MEIDAVFVRDVELDQTERVPGAGRLPQFAAAQHLDVLACQVPRRAMFLRPQLFVGDAVGHVPVRAEDDLRDVAAEDGRPQIVLADDDPHRHHGAAVLRQHEREGRNVDEGVRIAEVRREPAPALEIQLDLPDARGRFYVELRARARSHDAIGLEPLERLESPHGTIEIGIKFVTRLRKVSAGGETCGELRDRRSSVAEAERFLRVDFRPSACGVDAPVRRKPTAQCRVFGMRRRHAHDGRSHFMQFERGLQRCDEIVRARRQAPRRLDRFRIDAARQKVRGEQKEGVGEQNVALLRIGRALDGGQVIVSRIETIALRIANCGEQIVAIARAPRRRKLPAAVEKGKGTRRADRIALHDDDAPATQRVDYRPDRDRLAMQRDRESQRNCDGQSEHERMVVIPRSRCCHGAHVTG